MGIAARLLGPAHLPGLLKAHLPAAHQALVASELPAAAMLADAGRAAVHAAKAAEALVLSLAPVLLEGALKLLEPAAMAAEAAVLEAVESLLTAG